MSIAQPAVEVRNVTKKFAGVVALNAVTLDLKQGEVTAIVGENGAGKSTLMKVLAGLYSPDAGSVTIFGAQSTFSPTRLLNTNGVALVPQEIALMSERTVAQNILLGMEALFSFSTRRRDATARALLDRIETPLDPSRLAGSLTVSEQQLVIVARALARNCRMLIFDEPTASLTPHEANRLLRLISSLRSQGVTIAYVSHRLPEVFSSTDMIHVLRDGALTGTFVTSETSSPEIIRAMVGRNIEHRTARGKPAAAGSAKQTDRIEVISLATRAVSVHDLRVATGEIVGVAGLADSGRSELLLSLFGAQPSTQEVRMDGRPVSVKSPKDAIALGIGFVPAERRSQGILASMTVAQNMASLDVDRARFGIVPPHWLRNLAANRARLFDVRGSLSGSITNLSGGNQQKVILARWIAHEPRLLLLDEPTRGIDVGARQDIHDRIRALAERGCSVLLSSSDLAELGILADRVLVMRHGEIVGEMSPDASEEDIIALAAGALQVEV
ncbi:MAG: sugar ABC transporter ATP-binding protein [Phycisphaerae bacterium]|nr:sugar ABC transporter ATP-binding protein [Phycisphaerae bacterium]